MKKTKVAEEKNDVPDTPPEATPSTGDPKQKADDLWADFMKDTGFTSKNTKATSPSSSQIAKTPIQSTSRNNKKETEPEKQAEKVKITQIFEFAGEEVKVEKEVDPNSAEARLLSKAPVKKKAANLNGLGNVLNQLGKKQKISTLEKTKLDWEKFKKDENIIEELEIHNKGKDGYLDKQDFLQRADVRRFEIEKDVRNAERAKRLN
ncbi:unnamed protein product [Ceutorhynchus assimilis]|uniref:Craniofacial development protein 1 n=1 Tax=Ceutorhynchus assimilis TaxID=467358 RepID=A0A9P0DDM2_9CUCU|nr:unnamed protein product [Ceutorhynchus assimilis]